MPSVPNGDFLLFCGALPSEPARVCAELLLSLSLSLSSLRTNVRTDAFTIPETAFLHSAIYIKTYINSLTQFFHNNSDSITNRCYTVYISKYAICGLGLEGRAAIDYYRAKEPDADILLVDENATDADIRKFSEIPEDYTIIRSPGVSPHKLPSTAVKDGRVWSSTNEFFKNCPCPIIGVTGTKGKGTTSSIIARLLEAHLPNEQAVHLLGNIGVPALSKLAEIKADDVVIFELSSFQLWDLQFSPHISVLTIFEPDHLDVHESFDEYLQAKANIWQHQTTDDTLIYNNNDSILKEMLSISVGVTSASQPATITSVKAQKQRYPAGNAVIAELSRKVNLPGLHNQYNTQAAILAMNQYLLEVGITPNNIITEMVLENFSGLDHRLKHIATVNDVSFYDDSIATTPSSAIAGLRSFDTPAILLLGGKDKGGDYGALATELGNKMQIGKLRGVIVYGENRERIVDAIGNTFENSMAPLITIDADDAKQAFREIFAHIRTIAVRGDTVLFSPAAASFDMFKNYAQRGQTFIDFVNEMTEDLAKCARNGKFAHEVAVFDSGKGGDFVASEFARIADTHPLLPRIKWTLYQDTKNVPYGSKTPSEIRELTEKCLAPTLTHDTKQVVKVLACNTATAYAIDDLRAKYPEHKFVGFEPMIKPASLSSDTGNICVLATPATLCSERYRALKEKYAASYQVFEPDCTSWAAKIEHNEFSVEDILPIVELIKDQNIDQVILACTHYIAVKELIEQCFTDANVSVTVLEPTDAIFRRTLSFVLNID